MRIAAKVREGAAPARRPEGALPGKAHVCFVAPHAWPAFSQDRRIPEVGGAEVQQAVLARLLAGEGYRVSMICLDYGQPDGAVIDGVTVRTIFRPAAGLPVLRFVHPRLTSMWRALRAVDADIYYFRSAAMWAGVIAQFCRRHGKRSIYAAASDRDFSPDYGGQIRYARDRWLFRRGVATVDAVVVQNEHQRKQCRAMFGREARLVPSCYRLPESAKPGRGDAVLWVGTLHENKRPELLLEAARLLPHRRFVLIGGPRAGDRSFFEDIRARAASLPNVTLTGFLPLADVERRFDEARVLANTSEYEGMPNTFLQAWARGVPTVATVDVGAPVHRVVSDAGELAAAIEELYRDPARWQRDARAAREYFERRHSCAEALERYARLFDELLA